MDWGGVQSSAELRNVAILPSTTPKSCSGGWHFIVRIPTLAARLLDYIVSEFVNVDLFGRTAPPLLKKHAKVRIARCVVDASGFRVRLLGRIQSSCQKPLSKKRFDFLDSY